MSEEFDLLDIYLAKQNSGGADARLPPTGKNLGHRLFCPDCRTFTRHEVTLDEKSVELVLRCRMCENTERYVFTSRGWMPKKMREEFKRFAMERGREAIRSS